MRSGERGSEAASREGDKEGSGDAAARLSANLRDETSLELGRVSAPRAVAPPFAGDRPGPQPGARDGHAGHVATGPCATEPGPGRPAETEGLAAPSRGPRWFPRPREPVSQHPLRPGFGSGFGSSRWRRVPTPSPGTERQRSHKMSLVTARDGDL